MPRVLTKAGQLHDDFPFALQNSVLHQDFEDHRHLDFTEIVILLGGAADHRIDERVYPTKPGDVFVFHGAVAHGFRRVRHLHLCNLLFDPEKVMWTTPQVRNLTGFQALFVLAPYYRKQKEFRPHLQLPPADLQAVMETIRTMEGELQQRATGYESMVQALFLRLIVILCRCYALAPPAETHILRLAEVLSHLEVHYRDALNMDDLARHARLSRRHFARVFRRHYGTSPMDYVIRLRLQHACRLLRRGDCTISEAAFASGFEDSNYFARLFRRRLGLSPRAWRTGDRQAENDAPTAR